MSIEQATIPRLIFILQKILKNYEFADINLSDFLLESRNEAADGPVKSREDLEIIVQKKVRKSIFGRKLSK